MSPQALGPIISTSSRQERGAFRIEVSRRIEHRLIWFITQNWRARPIVSY
jgi:hypothetical protein